MKNLVVAATLLAVCLGGCSAIFPPRAESPPKDDLIELKKRVLELQRQAKISEVELERLRRQVAELDARLGPAASPGASQPLPSIEREPRFEERAENDGPIGGGVSGEDLPPVEPTLTAPPVDAVPSRVETGGTGSAASAVTVEAQRLYDRGYTLFHQGRYLDAESSFQQFLQQHGATDLGDNAQFWIGECRYQRGDWSGALAAFRETVQRYPQGNKVPDALFKTGTCLAQLGDTEGARAAYDEVIRRYPATAAAALAADRRAELP